MSHGAFAITEQEDGKKLFVDNACPGDEIEYEVYNEHKSFSYANITELITESPLRAKDPKCKIHKVCGSCQWQHIDYQEQLKFKKQNLLDFIQHSKIDISNIEIADVIPMEDPWNYRNKVIYPVDTVPSTGRLMAGYFKRNSNELINVKHCPIQYSIFDEIIERVKDLCTENGIIKKFLRHILVRSNSNKKQILVCLIVRNKELEKENYLKLRKTLKQISEEFSIIKSTSINYNDQSTNVILGSKSEVVTGKGYIIDNFGDLNLKISAESFYQVNTSQFSKIIDLIEPHIKDGDKILDAYCGIGTISLSLAKRKANLSITGIEIIKTAVENAQLNALDNAIEAVYIHSKIEDNIEDFRNEDFDALIINPPRKGCTTKVLHNLGEIKSKKIIYVSCNPATLTRDIEYLQDFGYKTTYIQAIDMFPHSFHFETLAILERS
jgi:23S rRNA (uracil1939-C5)-methyltransferase